MFFSQKSLGQGIWRWEWREIGFCEKSVGSGRCEGEGAIFLSTQLIRRVLVTAARLKTPGFRVALGLLYGIRCLVRVLCCEGQQFCEPWCKVSRNALHTHPVPETPFGEARARVAPVFVVVTIFGP